MRIKSITLAALCLAAVLIRASGQPSDPNQYTNWLTTNFVDALPGSPQLWLELTGKQCPGDGLWYDCHKNAGRFGHFDARLPVGVSITCPNGYNHILNSIGMNGNYQSQGLWLGSHQQCPGDIVSVSWSSACGSHSHRWTAFKCKLGGSCSVPVSCDFSSSPSRYQIMNTTAPCEAYLAGLTLGYNSVSWSVDHYVCNPYVFWDGTVNPTAPCVWPSSWRRRLAGPGWDTAPRKHLINPINERMSSSVPYYNSAWAASNPRPLFPDSNPTTFGGLSYLDQEDGTNTFTINGQWDATNATSLFILASTNLADWITVTNVAINSDTNIDTQHLPLPPIGTTNYFLAGLDSSSNGTPGVSGSVRISTPAGVHFYTAPFWVSTNNDADELIGSIPDGSVFGLFNGSNYTYYYYDTITGTSTNGWYSDYSSLYQGVPPKLPPGVGFYYNPGDNSTNNFSGELTLPRGSTATFSFITNFVGGTTNLIGGLTPFSGCLTNAGPGKGNWPQNLVGAGIKTGSGGSYTLYWQSNTVWYNATYSSTVSPPSLKMCEGFFYIAPNGSAGGGNSQ